jgi:hypothetical protein
MNKNPDDEIEIKDPDRIEQTVNLLFETLKQPEIKELDFIHKHFKLYNDENFKRLAEENTYLFNKILKGEFDDPRNREVLNLVLTKMREMKDGTCTIFEGEKIIGQLLSKLFPLKKKDTSGNSKSDKKDFIVWKEEYVKIKNENRVIPKEFENHFAVLSIMEESNEIIFTDNNNVEKELKQFNKIFKEMN